MEGDYQSHARSLQKRATEAHSEWVASLSPAQRANLAQLGVLLPADDSAEVGGHSPWQEADVAESPRARVEPDMAAELDSPEALLADRFGIDLPTAAAIVEWHLQEIKAALMAREADLLSIVVGGLIGSQNIRISSGGLAFAAGLDAVNGLGCPADYARKLGVSRSAISKSMRAWKRDLGLTTNAHQKSEQACETYSALGKSNHWRTQKVKASALAAKLHRHLPPSSTP